MAREENNYLRRQIFPLTAQADGQRYCSCVPSPRLTPLEDEAWQGLLYAHDRIWREIEAGLAPLGMSMAEYSVLALLARAGGDGMRMSELAKRRVMSSGGFTRMADRLEQRGLIERRRAAEDGRGYVAVLTQEGRSALREAWQQQYRDLRRLFLDRLDESDLQSLARVWQRLDAPPATDEPADE